MRTHTCTHPQNMHVHMRQIRTAAYMSLTFPAYRSLFPCVESGRPIFVGKDQPYISWGRVKLAMKTEGTGRVFKKLRPSMSTPKFQLHLQAEYQSGVTLLEGRNLIKIGCSATHKVGPTTIALTHFQAVLCFVSLSILCPMDLCLSSQEMSERPWTSWD